MRVWRKKYAAAGIYIGGVNAACSYGNLSAGWVRSAAGLGFGFLPTYVGPQAPCWNGRGVLIDPANATAEGTAGGIGRGERRPPLRPAQGIACLLRHGGLHRRCCLHGGGARVHQRVGQQAGRVRLHERRLLEPGLGDRRPAGGDRGQGRGVHAAQGDLDRAVGQRCVARTTARSPGRCPNAPSSTRATSPTPSAASRSTSTRTSWAARWPADQAGTSRDQASANRVIWFASTAACS